MRYQSVDNAFFTVNVSMDVDSGVQVCDSFPVTGAVEGRCMGTHAQFMYCACALLLVLPKRTSTSIIVVLTFVLRVYVCVYAPCLCVSASVCICSALL